MPRQTDLQNLHPLDNIPALPLLHDQQQAVEVLQEESYHGRDQPQSLPEETVLVES